MLAKPRALSRWESNSESLHQTQGASNRAKLNDSGRDQYICHMGFAGTDPQWNMELWKPAKPLAAWVTSLCN